MSTVQAPASAVRSHAPVVALGAASLALILAALALAWVVTRDDSETAGATEGSGVAAMETRELAPFSAVELSGVNDVTIGVGGEQLVVVRADDNLVERVTTEVRGGVLVIDETGSFEAVTPLSVELTVPSLDEVSLSGDGSIMVEGHELHGLSVVLSGTGTIRAAGTASTLDVELAGTGEADLAGLVARDATVVLSGTGAVVVHVTGTLDVDVSGTGSVTYTGDPDHVVQQVTGTGSIAED